MPTKSARLFANKAFRRHVETVASGDALFFLSHRHYLVRGLTFRQRCDAAVFHYEHEVSTFGSEYVDAVYEKGGLLLWRIQTQDAVVEIRLMSGIDVLYEGGISLVLYVNGGRYAVLSYSSVRSSVFLPSRIDVHSDVGHEAVTLFIARKQLAADHSYQQVFNKAVDRSTPGHLLFAALTGVALAQGIRRVIAISPDVHPSCTVERRQQFDLAYSQFWESLSGRKLSPYGYVIDLPMQMTPLAELDLKARKRAVARREHIDSVAISSQTAISQHIVKSAPSFRP
jgi:uncharacterized protein VirK/YbjX